MRTEINGTWIDAEELAYNVPLKKSPRRGLARFPDGKLRMVRLGVPDTFFTIPARASDGRHGYVTSGEEGFTFHYNKRA